MVSNKNTEFGLPNNNLLQIFCQESAMHGWKEPENAIGLVSGFPYKRLLQWCVWYCTWPQAKKGDGEKGEKDRLHADFLPRITTLACMYLPSLAYTSFQVGKSV